VLDPLTGHAGGLAQALGQGAQDRDDFAALEVPGLLTADVREFFGPLTAGGAGAASSR
jgi:hypothetical protein